MYSFDVKTLQNLLLYLSTIQYHTDGNTNNIISRDEWRKSL